MKDQKRKKISVKPHKHCRSGREACASEDLGCDVCLSQGEPCAAMAQYLVTGQADTVECELIKHSF